MTIDKETLEKFRLEYRNSLEENSKLGAYIIPRWMSPMSAFFMKDFDLEMSKAKIMDEEDEKWKKD